MITDARPRRFARLILALGLGAIVFFPAALSGIELLWWQSRGGAPLVQGLTASSFLYDLASSFVYSLMIAGTGTLLALLLNPGFLGGQRSSRLRIAALAIGVFLPPVLLVLMGSNLVRTVGFGKPVALFLAHLVAIYPAAALVLTLWFEGFFVQVFTLAQMRQAGVVARLGLIIRLRGVPLASVLLIVSSVAFQDYLINMTLRRDPSSDALVALVALFPQTGVQWNVAMAAVLVIFALYGFLSVLAAKVIKFS